MRPRHTDVAPGWILRRFKKVEKAIKEQAAARRMESATIGAGGITIKDGGKIVVPYPTDIGTGHAVFIGPEILDGIKTFTFRVMDPTGAHVVMGAQVIPSQPPLFPTQSTQTSMYGDLATLEGVQEVVAWLPATGEGLVVLPGTTTLTSAGQLALNGGTGGVRIAHSTTGAAANCFIDPSDNRIWRSTSSLRYKQDVEVAEVDPADVLRLQPKTWRDKAEVEADPATERRYTGLVAEDLHELPTMRQFVVYDDEGQPEAIAEPRLFVALVELAKSQEKRLAALEALVPDDEGPTKT